MVGVRVGAESTSAWASLSVVVSRTSLPTILLQVCLALVFSHSYRQDSPIYTMRQHTTQIGTARATCTTVSTRGSLYSKLCPALRRRAPTPHTHAQICLQARLQQRPHTNTERTPSALPHCSSALRPQNTRLTKAILVAASRLRAALGQDDLHPRNLREHVLQIGLRLGIVRLEVPRL